ncbi:MAG TPA: cysteine--tRNA ligase [Streptosporangiaceae bacterium]|nr:cysteine--tRNA ligase [Streptosporangiaceae bacterium]
MLRLYDTRLRSVADIIPARPGELRMYACGPTVYRFAHVGNLRTFLLPDLIRRNAERHHLSVIVCQNITDVGHLADDGEADPEGEDKILAQARAEGRSALEVARFYEDAFRADSAALNIAPPDYAPRASDSIDLMIEMISTLIDTGHAYPTDSGSVYFDARSVPDYGALSGNRLDELRPGHRSEGSVDESKRFHADWALWKGAPAGRELTWQAPWGTGFPGWHTECSAMSLKFLGDVIDIHTGGIDLRFPHHEDERAQSNSIAGHDVVRHWVHGEHVLFEGRKMAKSTGNVVLLSDVTGRGLDPLAVRLAFLDHRYRQQMNLTWETLTAADGTVRRWREQVADWANEPSKPMCADYWARITGALDDDLDTPAALRALRELARDSGIPAGSKFETFAAADRVLALDLVSLVGQPRRAPALPAGAQEILAERAAAREQKDFASSDRLRAELAELGVAVADTPDGQTWTLTPAAGG